MEKKIKAHVDEIEKAKKGVIFFCAPLGNNTCNQEDLIKEGFSGKNIFFDIPFTGYEKRENMLREVIKIAKLNAVIAKDELTSNVILCKVCRSIQCCKYGLADISFGRHSVTYELGLMHGFGRKVCILLQEGSGKFTDIHGLEHTSYTGEYSLKINFARWLSRNVAEADKQALNAFIKEHQKVVRDKGEIIFPPITLKKTYDDLEKEVQKSKTYGENRFDTVKKQINNKKYFFISATPVPLKDDIIDVGEEKIKNILLHPSYRRDGGWNMDFTDYHNNINPSFEGLEKNSNTWLLKLFRNGYSEFQALVDFSFSWSQGKKEFEISPRFDPYAIIEFPVSFIRFVKELIQERHLTKSYVIRMAYLNCGEYKLRPYGPRSYGHVTNRNEKSAALDNWSYEKVFEELDMSSDIEALTLVERLYSTFGHFKDKIPFFNENKVFEIRDEI